MWNSNRIYGKNVCSAMREKNPNHRIKMLDLCVSVGVCARLCVCITASSKVRVRMKEEERERGFVTNRRTYAEPKPMIFMGSCILYALIMYIYFIVCAPQPWVSLNNITVFCPSLLWMHRHTHPFPYFTTP